MTTTLTLIPQSKLVNLYMKVFYQNVAMLLIAVLTVGSINAQEDASLNPFLDQSLEDLFDMEVESASGLSESYLKAPATMNIISAQDIKDRAYTSLDEVLMDIPGFDVTISNGTTYMQAYQRGYRTPFTQRTLIMVDGKVDNHLWSHMANISRQYPVQNIEKIEVLYGPASAVYGANAFLGIINVITKDGAGLEDGQSTVSSSIQAGSNNTRSTDVFVAGKEGEISYSLGAKVFKSDEEDLSSKFRFLSNDFYGDRKRWGPILDQNNLGVNYGTYTDPTDDWGINGKVQMGNVTFGFNNWVRQEAYGPYYAADRTQNNAFWNYSSNQYYVDYDKEVNDKLSVQTSLLYRNSRVWGEWAEATAMWDSTIHALDNGDKLMLSDRGIDDADYADYSFVSLTDWNSVNHSMKFTQNAQYQMNDKWLLSGGVKYEQKKLTKAYDIPGYWGVYSSIDDGIGDGPHGQGTGIGNSSDETYQKIYLPSNFMPTDNLISTEDVGGYLQSIYDVSRIRFQTGIRYDRNSIYGDSINPRISASYVFPDEVGTVKLVYGEAFQEPAPIQLFGGWNGRSANPDLLPEKARNIELMTMYKHHFLFHQLSVYNGRYENVIKEEAENAGSRNVLGLEYRLMAQVEHPLSTRKINMYGYYTYTDVVSSVSYDFEKGAWIEEEAELGDIAPHKIHLGINVPIKKHWHINLRSQYVSDQTPYLRNTMRASDYVIPSYLNLDGNIGLDFDNISFGLKARNLMDVNYFYSGVESASAGNDFVNGSAGFHNSLIPNASRNFLFYMNGTF